MFCVISVYFNVRNILPKSGTFLPGHPVYPGRAFTLNILGTFNRSSVWFNRVQNLHEKRPEYNQVIFEFITFSTYIPTFTCPLCDVGVYVCMKRRIKIERERQRERERAYFP